MVHDPEKPGLTQEPGCFSSTYERREAFREELSEELAATGVRLVYPDLGYLPDGRHVWHLTIEVPRGAVTLFAALSPEADPYARETAAELGRRVERWLARSPGQPAAS